MRRLAGIDFELANGIPGSICAYGIYWRNGDNSYGVVGLHPEKGGVQERSAYHGISPELTAAGGPPEWLYEKLLTLYLTDTTLCAHDARIDRRALNAWFEMWDLKPLPFRWIDTLKIAQRHYGKTAKTGVAIMAERMGMTVTPHDPVDDAEVALQIALRYDWGNIQPIVDIPAESR